MGAECAHTHNYTIYTYTKIDHITPAHLQYWVTTHAVTNSSSYFRKSNKVSTKDTEPVGAGRL